MIQLSPRDSSILARVAQSSALPKEYREAVIQQSKSVHVHEAGRIILGDDPAKFSAEVAALAKTYGEWAERNKKIRKRAARSRAR